MPFIKCNITLYKRHKNWLLKYFWFWNSIRLFGISCTGKLNFVSTDKYIMHTCRFVMNDKLRFVNKTRVVIVLNSMIIWQTYVWHCDGCSFSVCDVHVKEFWKPNSIIISVSICFLCDRNVKQKNKISECLFFLIFPKLKLIHNCFFLSFLAEGPHGKAFIHVIVNLLLDLAIFADMASNCILHY
jgi:hypothetical protein